MSLRSKVFAALTISTALMVGSFVQPALADTKPAGHMASDTHAMEAGQFVVLDMLPLKKGKTLEDATEYFDLVEPIFAKHNFYRTGEVLKVETVMRGKLKASVVNLWVTPNAQQSMQGIFSDKDYLPYTDLRDSIFDLKNATIAITSVQEGEE